MKATTTPFFEKKVHLGAFLLLGASVLSVPLIANAQNTANSELTQEISAGVLSTSIRDASAGGGVAVANPTFAMGAATVSTSMQTVTGTFGSESQRIYVNNPGASASGWTLALNATNTFDGSWTNGTETYAYNGSEEDGRLTVNAAAGTIVAVTGGETGVSPGGNSSFSGITPITIMVAAAESADIWNGYITGIGLAQTIPASTPAGSYTLDMTQTITAS